jgi:hypothetical protein
LLRNIGSPIDAFGDDEKLPGNTKYNKEIVNNFPSPTREGTPGWGDLEFLGFKGVQWDK